MGRTSTKDIQDFLDQCREIIKSSEVIPSVFFMVSKQENKDTLLSLGFTKQNVKDEIISLSLEDYCEGPCDAHEYKDQVWIFGKMISNQEIYIKLSISEFDNPGNRVKTLFCLSFHFSKKSMKYLYKRN